MNSGHYFQLREVCWFLFFFSIIKKKKKKFSFEAWFQTKNIFENLATCVDRRGKKLSNYFVWTFCDWNCSSYNLLKDTIIYVYKLKNKYKKKHNIILSGWMKTWSFYTIKSCRLLLIVYLVYILIVYQGCNSEQPCTARLLDNITIRKVWMAGT